MDTHSGSPFSEPAKPDRSSLESLAYSQDGYFTAQQAARLGFSSQLLAHHVRRGRFDRVRRGLYRLTAFPSSPQDAVRAHWLAVGPERAVVSHESALELLGLADVIPSAVHLIVPRRHRGFRPPEGVVLHTTVSPLPPSDVVRRQGLPVTAPARSIVDSAKWGTGPEQIDAAVHDALDRGLTTASQLRRAAAGRGPRVKRIIEGAIARQAAFA